MFLNGWHQANDSPGMVQFHSLLGELPVLLQPASPARAPRRDAGVLVIGLGGGATAGAAAAFPRTHLDVVELSGSVVRGRALLRPRQRRAWSPRPTCACARTTGATTCC